MMFKKINIFFAFLVILVLGILFENSLSDNADTNQSDCIIKAEIMEVRGDSLSPLIQNGDKVSILYGYYECYDIKRGDIVAYKYATNTTPIIKIVKGLPGDKWFLNENGDGTYSILVNGAPITNSEGKLYLIPENNIKILQRYADSHPSIPNNTYLIFGNEIAGTFDSTRFGLIDRSDIVGKVMID